MIRIYEQGEDLSKVYQRSQLTLADVTESVRAILKDVLKNGDAALLEYAKKFDNTDLSGGIRVSEEEIDVAYQEVPKDLLASLRRARDNILSYHKAQLRKDSILEKDGCKTGYVVRPVDRAGIYVPGGLASYPSSVLMCACPAVAAGVREIAMVTPFKDGKTNPLTLVAARECGVTEIYKAGTQSVKKVDVITGPGNIYVTLAKKEVFGMVGIDMIAGPSEILIVADGTVRSDYAAADMLSQAEHDVMAASILITPDRAYAEAVASEVARQTELLPKAEIVKKSLADNGAIIVTKDLEEAFDIANRIAPEHMELLLTDAESFLDRVQNAGAVFVGESSPEPLGDYYAGPDHVLPTSGTAKYFSALSADNYIKKISVIGYTKKALAEAADDIIAIAECEGLQAHANAVKVRKEG